DISVDSTLGSNVVLSPDGDRLVYVSRGRLFSKRLNQTKAIELSRTEGVKSPFFSPDGQWVAFFAPGQLRKASEGGWEITLCHASSAVGGGRSEDGSTINALR